MKNIRKLFAIAILVVGVIFGDCGRAYADDNSNSSGFAMSPMSERILLNPGETYEGSFKIIYRGVDDGKYNYKIDVQPYFVSDDYQSSFEEVGDYSKIVDWIEIDTDVKGALTSSEKEKIIPFTIVVPANAPAGGQYAAIVVGNDLAASNNQAGVALQERTAIGYTIYAEVTGDTIRRGEISDLSVPSFLLDGNIEASSSVSNTGNVHGTAKYTLQIWPLFSNEEVFTNEEDPDLKNIMPERTFLNKTVWDNTPAAGVFNVKYTVEFEGVTREVSKMVIKCPIWLLFIIIFAVVVLIVWLYLRAKNKGKKSRKSDD